MKKAKYVVLLALLTKVMEQLDSILVDNSEVRVQHWKSNIYTIFEDIQDKMNEIENEKTE